MLTMALRDVSELLDEMVQDGELSLAIAILKADGLLPGNPSAPQLKAQLRSDARLKNPWSKTKQKAVFEQRMQVTENRLWYTTCGDRKEYEAVSGDCRDLWQSALNRAEAAGEVYSEPEGQRCWRKADYRELNISCSRFSQLREHKSKWTYKDMLGLILRQFRRLPQGQVRMERPVAC